MKLAFWGKPAQPTFADLTEDPPDSEVPFLDRRNVDESRLTPLQRQWRENGFVILRKVIPEELLEDYARWRKARTLPDHFGALPLSYGYMFVPEIRRIGLFKAVQDAMRELLGEPQVLQFDLTQWKSTERGWHQDDYLNPPNINGNYAAIWFAIDAIHPDCGPFEYVPGSNRWPVMRRDRVRAMLPRRQAKSDRWPQHSQDMVVGVFEEEIRRRGARTESFIADAGDALIWHARLVHRGSAPRNPSLPRKSLICHYRGHSTIEPKHHEVRSMDGALYIHHRDVTFRDWASPVSPFHPA